MSALHMLIVACMAIAARPYDSTQRDQSGDFGWGWRASGQDASVRKNMVLGLNWQVQARQLELCLAPAGQRRITISLPDGGLYRFKARNRSECGFAQIPPLDIVFEALPLPVGGGSGAGSAVAQLEVVNIPPLQAQGGVLYDMDALDVWNPRDFKLTTAEGAIYYLREGVGILRVTDPYGNSIDYGANGWDAQWQAHDVRGRALRNLRRFGRSACGRRRSGQGRLRGDIGLRIEQIELRSRGFLRQPSHARIVR